ncbi:MAG TPA: RteC domain-containing protein [Chitinophagaceae bacterium]|jgi:hypothetical protein
MGRIEENEIETIAENLTLTQSILLELKNIIESHHFKTEDEEIIFFKYIKPKFLSSFFYWETLLTFYLHMPVGGDLITSKYYNDKLIQLKSFFDANMAMYEYLRSNQNYLDNIYFLRSSGLSNNTIAHFEMNPKTTTAKDRLVSEIYANDLFEIYINELLSNQLNEPSVTYKKIPKVQWTGSRAGMVELIYALQSSGVLNNGQIEIKELAEMFEKLFGMKLGNYYHTFNEIRLRKKNRTSLLDLLREKIIYKMDIMDEK